MDEELEFIEKEIERLEVITKKTYYRLAYFRKVKMRLEGKKITNTKKPIQLSLFGT